MIPILLIPGSLVGTAVFAMLLGRLDMARRRGRSPALDMAIAFIWGAAAAKVVTRALFLLFAGKVLE